MKAKFVRYGVINSRQKQKMWNGVEEDFHHAPESRGFYAMPYDFQEPYLVGSILYATQSSHNYTRNEKNGGYNQSGKKIMRRIRRVFELDGRAEIWHHLVGHVPNNEVVARSGSWVKTTVEAYRKAIGKECAANRRQARTPTFERATYDFDGFEVFIPREIHI
jgi:hypothetical protein